MEILDLTAINLFCPHCGDRYDIPLRQVLLCEEVVRHGCCPIPAETECPPAHYGQLLDRDVLRQLQEVWRLLEEKVRAAGGELVFADRTLGMAKMK